MLFVFTADDVCTDYHIADGKHFLDPYNCNKYRRCVHSKHGDGESCSVSINECPENLLPQVCLFYDSEFIF